MTFKILLENSGYQFEPASKIWLKPSYASIAYSDGDEVEERLARIIGQATDLSVLSTQLSQNSTDWPSLYHLSSSRANILRPFETILSGADVLEIGAGCGAITRYLGEQCSNVIALEGALRRAAIARSRTRDLGNVEVVGDRFNEFSCEHKFDVVTLIGVLEYANMFTPSDQAARAMLERVRTFLKPGGKVIIAIENQLGLKYFAGAPEDHLGQPMYGIEGRYRENQPQTYGRRVLEKLLTQSGFSHSNFMAPFPDYKLPASIVTEEGFADPDFDASALAWQSVRRDPQLPPLLSFSPELAWPGVFDNGLALDLANSFLVVASSSDIDVIDRSILAYHYSTDRKAEYCKKTSFVRKGDGAIKVLCQQLSGETPKKSDASVLFHPETEVDYVCGHPLSWEFIEIVNRDGWCFDDIVGYFKRYLTILSCLTNSAGGAISVVVPDRDGYIYGRFIDAIPQNIICLQKNIYQLIDTEWQGAGEIPVARVLFRSILLQISGLTRFGRPAELKQSITRRDLIVEIFLRLGLGDYVADFPIFLKLESEFQQKVTGRSTEKFMEWWPDSILPMENINLAALQKDAQVADLTQAVVERDAQVADLTQAVVERDAQVADLTQAVVERDAQVADLTQAVVERDAQVADLTQAVVERDAQVADLTQAVVERDAQVADLTQAVVGRDAQIGSLSHDIAALRKSSSWRLTKPVRLVGHQLARAKHLIKIAPAAFQMGGGARATLGKAIGLYRREGISGIKRGIRMVQSANEVRPAIGSDTFDRNDYAEWVRRYDTIDDSQRQKLRALCDGLTKKPKISVVMPTYNPRPEWLIEAIESVRQQIYTNWELCIADDASSNPAIRSILEGYIRNDGRIKVVFRKQNGHISAASNSALELVSGEWIALLDHDDLLTEHALLMIAQSINANPCAGMIYSDEDKIDERGNRSTPYFKCDFNINLLRSQNMICHLGVYRSDLVKYLGGFRLGFEGSQDYDLALRVADLLEEPQILHVPYILYHWRIHSQSTAKNSSTKSYAQDAGLKALREHLHRRSIDGSVELTPFMQYRVRYSVPTPPPKVSLIIPTRNGLHLISQCIESIISKTTYSNYEILVIDNGSDDLEVLNYFSSFSGGTKVRIIRDDSPFNYSALNNRAVAHVDGEYIGLLNNDIEVITPEWLDEMLSLAAQKNAGAIGACLWYPNNTLQHGGVVLGVGGVAGHAHKFLSKENFGYFGRAKLVHGVSVVTGACLLVKKSIYFEVGGLNEFALAIAFNDVDFCLKVREAGYHNAWTPFAELYHHESASRGLEDTPEKQLRFAREIEYMQKTWAGALRNDPAYSPNLTLDHEDLSLAWPPRCGESWRIL